MGGGAGGEGGVQGGFASCRPGIRPAKPGRFVLGLPGTAAGSAAPWQDDCRWGTVRPDPGVY